MKVARVATALAVVALGGAGMMALIKARPEAKKKAPARRGALVEVSTAQPGAHRVPVVAHGLIKPAREVMISPEVSGRIVAQHPQLVVGGLLPAEAELVRVDDADYRLGLAQARAQLQQAEQALELEKGRQTVALREWKSMGGKDRGPGARATRVPQVKSAEASVALARAAVRLAAVRQHRTRIAAPFNAVVVAESVEVGQVVGPGSQLVRLVGTDTFWVEALLPARDLPLVALPAIPGGRGAPAKVVHVAGGQRVERSGHVVRRLGEVDPKSRMARLIIEVVDPLGLKAPAPALLLNAFVEVVIEGPTLEGVFAVPRSALREGDAIWAVGPDDTLVVKAVTVARRLDELVLVDAGIEAGDRLVTSRLASPVEGMTLRVKGAPPAVARVPDSAAGSTP